MIHKHYDDEVIFPHTTAHHAISASEWQYVWEQRENDTMCFYFHIEIQSFGVLWYFWTPEEDHKQWTFSFLSLFSGHWGVFPVFTSLGVPCIFTKNPCISSIATIIFQITCFMLLFSCRRDSAPAALRSQSLWIHTTLICLFPFPQKDRLHRLKHQTSLPVLDVS